MENGRIVKYILVLLVILFIAFSVGIAKYEVLYPDSCLYLSFAKEILKGHLSFDFRAGVLTVFPPLYPLLVAVVSFFTGDLEVSGVWVSALAGGLLILAVFYLGQAIYGRVAAWISLFLVLFSPVLLHWSGTLLTESLFILLFTAAVVLGWFALNLQKKVLFFITGGVIALAYLTRVPGIILLVVMSFWIFLFLLAKKMDLKNALISLSILLLAFALVAGPYLIHLHSVFSQWNISGSYGSVAGFVEATGAHSVAGWEGQKNEEAEKSRFQHLSEKVLTNLGDYSGSLFLMISIGTLLIVAGMMPKGRPLTLFGYYPVLYLLSFILAYFMMLLILPLSPFQDERIRYLSPLLPILLILAAGGVTHFHGWTKGFKVQYVVIPLGVTLMVLFSSIPQLSWFPVHPSRLWEKNQDVNYYERIGVSLNRNVPHPIRMMSRKPYLPYYADATWFMTPPTYEEVLTLARTHSVNYLVIDRGVDYYLRPALRFLLDPQKAPPELKYLYGIRNSKTGYLYIGIYQIRR